MLHSNPIRHTKGLKDDAAMFNLVILAVKEMSNAMMKLERISTVIA